MRIRLWLMISGILVVGIYLLAGGSFAGPKNVILIEFGMYPDEFEGLEVYIDGQPAGELRRFGNAFKTGFEVDDGEHTVSVAHPDYECRPTRVFTGVGGQKVHLILDVMETTNDFGESETVFYFQR
jgi:hypothetical protein